MLFIFTIWSKYTREHMIYDAHFGLNNFCFLFCSCLDECFYVRVFVFVGVFCFRSKMFKFLFMCIIWLFSLCNSVWLFGWLLVDSVAISWDLYLFFMPLFWFLFTLNIFSTTFLCFNAQFINIIFNKIAQIQFWMVCLCKLHVWGVMLSFFFAPSFLCYRLVSIFSIFLLAGKKRKRVLYMRVTIHNCVRHVLVFKTHLNYACAIEIRSLKATSTQRIGEKHEWPHSSKSTRFQFLDLFNANSTEWISLHHSIGCSAKRTSLFFVQMRGDNTAPHNGFI